MGKMELFLSPTNEMLSAIGNCLWNSFQKDHGKNKRCCFKVSASGSQSFQQLHLICIILHVPQKSHMGLAFQNHSQKEFPHSTSEILCKEIG